jgi:hypothetical protein
MHQTFRGTTENALGIAFVHNMGSLGAFVGPLIFGLSGGGQGPNAWVSHAVFAAVFGLAAIIAGLMNLALVTLVSVAE